MNTETMITELKAVAEKHKNDKLFTFQTNITAMCGDIIPKLERLAEYEAIGTVEECREARERQRAKKPFKALEHQKKSGYKHKCPKCGCAVGYVEKTPFRKRVLIEHAAPYCCVCGQKLNWSE